MAAPQLTVSTLSPLLRSAQYAVRGAIVLRAMDHQKALEAGESRPFEKLIYCNIGNPQQLAQKPLTFPRQVLSALLYPDILEVAPDAFPADVVARTRAYLDNISGGTGAYSESQGVEYIRREVAEFITRRDGHPAHPQSIFLTDGASPGVQSVLRAILRDSGDGVLVPIPQYPLYSAGIAVLGGTMVGYNLVESTNWGLDMDILGRSLTEGISGGHTMRALAVINPGNPTGGCLSEDNAKQVVEFCVENNLILMADEVYQENIWADGKSFTSFKKIAADMGLVGSGPDDYAGLQLVSFHSVSKGFTGECGRRGGYFELVGFDADVKAQLYKSASISLCPNVLGQCMVGLMVNPPKPGDASYDLYVAERDGILSSLKRRATKLANAFNAMEGVSCKPPEGALYIFPQFTLPAGVAAAAAGVGMEPDAFYCTRMLDATGVVVVPGSGFGQEEGTFHFRTTILPPEDEVDTVVEHLRTFHNAFLAEYA